MRAALNARLRANHYETVFAEDAMAAISATRKEAPDLVLLDIGLPAGGGFAVLDRLRKNSSLSHIPVIVLSASSPQENEARALEAGARAFLQKPVENDELLAAIKSALGEGEEVAVS